MGDDWKVIDEREKEEKRKKKIFFLFFFSPQMNEKKNQIHKSNLSYPSLFFLFPFSFFPLSLSFLYFQKNKKQRTEKPDPRSHSLWLSILFPSFFFFFFFFFLEGEEGGGMDGIHGCVSGIGFF